VPCQLNSSKAVNKYPQLKSKSAEELISDLNSVPKDIRTTVRNNGGSHVNHTMYWKIMSPNGGGEPTGAITIRYSVLDLPVQKFLLVFFEDLKGRIEPAKTLHKPDNSF